MDANHIVKKSNIDEDFLNIMKERTAGDPMHEGVYWTNFSQREIAKLMQACGHKISTFVVKQLLKKHSFGQRKVQKRTTMKRVANRNQQFEKIAELKESYKLELSLFKQGCVL